MGLFHIVERRRQAKFVKHARREKCNQDLRAQLDFINTLFPRPPTRADPGTRPKETNELMHPGTPHRSSLSQGMPNLESLVRRLKARRLGRSQLTSQPETAFTCAAHLPTRNRKPRSHTHVHTPTPKHVASLALPSRHAGRGALGAAAGSAAAGPAGALPDVSCERGTAAHRGRHPAARGPARRRARGAVGVGCVDVGAGCCLTRLWRGGCGMCGCWYGLLSDAFVARVVAVTCQEAWRNWRMA
eukprot:359704-Chlamydomonas_euryale.AAC.1